MVDSNAVNQTCATLTLERHLKLRIALELILRQRLILFFCYIDSTFLEHVFPSQESNWNVYLNSNYMIQNKTEPCRFRSFGNHAGY